MRFLSLTLTCTTSEGCHWQWRKNFSRQCIILKAKEDEIWKYKVRFLTDEYVKTKVAKSKLTNIYPCVIHIPWLHILTPNSAAIAPIASIERKIKFIPGFWISKTWNQRTKGKDYYDEIIHKNPSKAKKYKNKSS